MTRNKKLIRKSAALTMALTMAMSSVPGVAVYAESADASGKIVNLKTDYMVNPMGIDAGDVKFSWAMETSRTGAAQKSYEITVTDDQGNVVWNTKADSDVSTDIAYEGDALQLETGYTWTVTVTAENGDVYTSEPATFETGTSFDGVQWITQAKEDSRAPLFRTETTLSDKEIASARLYITSLGIYDAYINGQKVLAGDTDDIFNPGWVEYSDYVNYQTYDVTSYLQKGTANCIGVVLGNGWYKGRIGSNAGYENVFGDQSVYQTDENGEIAKDERGNKLVDVPGTNELALLAKLVVTYTDGTEETVTTNDESWTYSNESPYLTNDYYDGETYDANVAKAIEGWNEAGYATDDSWEPVGTGEYYGTVKASAKASARIADELTRTPVAAYTYNESENQPADDTLYYGSVTEHEADPSQTMELKKGDVLIVDMGQNMVGVSELTVSGAQGTVVTQRFAEMLNDGKDPDGEEGTCGSDGPKGTIYTASLINGGMRDALCKDEYTLSGDGQEVYQADFTYHGYRYIEITATEDVTIEGIKGIVITSTGEQTGFIETSDEDVNQLFSNVLWGEIGNYLSIPTDCPQRAERFGWSGDAQLFSQTGVFNFDVTSFMENYVQIMNSYAKLYEEDYGPIYASVMPYGYFNGVLGCGWSDAGVIIPWVLYQQNGDTSLLEKYYDQMNTYVDYVHENGYNDFLFGDWLAFSAASTQCINMEYEYYVSQIMGKIATLLDKTDDAEKFSGYCDEIKTAFLDKYVDEEGNLLSGSADGFPEVGFSNAPTMDNAQTGLLWALKLGLYDSEETKNTMIQNLVANIHNENGSVREGQPEDSLSVGFLGVNVILPVLTEIGEADVAYDLLFQDQNPSWMYAVKNGATTIWERWNSYSEDESFGDSGMNSFNHYSYGSCVEWMYNYMSGIKADEDAPAFKHIILQPSIDTKGRLDSVKGSYESMYGTIESSWEAKDGQLTSYTATVPANTTATLYLPVTEDQANALELPEGASYAGMEEHNGIQTAKIELEAGSYSFSVE